MNKWFYRAVGTVGVASGFLMLAGGVAQADEADAAQPAVDPQQLRGLLDDYLTPTAGTLPLTPPGADRAVDGLPTAGPTDVAGNDLALRGPLPDMARGLPLSSLTPLTPPQPVREAAPLPGAGSLLPGTAALPGAGSLLPGTAALPGAPALPGAGSALPGVPSSVGALPPAGAALPGGDSTVPDASSALAGGGPALAGGGSALADAAGPLDGLRSGNTSLPVRNDQLNADPVTDTLPTGVLPKDVRPTVQTGAVGTELPVVGPLGVDSANGTAQMPALIGDTMAAQRSGLFGTVAKTESDLPLFDSLPVLGALTGAGLTDALPALDGGLPGADRIGSLPALPTSAPLPTSSSLPTDGAVNASLPSTGGLPTGATQGLPGVGAGRDLPGIAGKDLPGVAGQAVRPAQPAGIGRHAAPRPGKHAAKPGRHTAAGHKASAPARPALGAPTGRAAERPVAGEDADFR